MRDWIIILVLYAANVALFRVLGGFSAAGEAFRRWGRASSKIRSTQGSPSS